MPAELPLADVTHNVAAAAQLALGIERSDLDLIRSGLADRIHQPRRAHLFPRSMELIERASELGALGATISGAGPTVLVWTFWQSGPGLLAELEAFADGWAEVRQGPVLAARRPGRDLRNNRATRRAPPCSTARQAVEGASSAFWRSLESCSSSCSSRAANSGGGS